MTMNVYGLGTVKNVQSRTFGKDNDRVSYRGEIEALDGTNLQFDAGPDDVSEHEGKIMFFNGRYEKISYVKKDTGEHKTFNALRLVGLADPSAAQFTQQPAVEAATGSGGYNPDDDIPF